MNTHALAISLTDRAAEIHREHMAALEHAASAVSHARKAGELLIDAKSQLKHGDWLPWLEAHVSFSARTARNYMYLATEAPKLDASKWQRVADLPLRRAVSEIHHMRREAAEHQRREILAKPAKMPSTAGITKTWDYWTSPRLLLTRLSETERTDRAWRRRVLFEHAQHQLKSPPEHLADLGDDLPGIDAVLGLMASLSARAKADLKRRIGALVDWIEAANREIAEPLRTLAECSSPRIDLLLARNVERPDGSGSMHIDLRFADVPAHKFEHADGNCECENALPFGIKRLLSAKRCERCDRTLRQSNYCGEGEMCTGCTAELEVIATHADPADRRAEAAA